jgi:hypothetical protein
MNNVSQEEEIYKHSKASKGLQIFGNGAIEERNSADLENSIRS